MIRNETKHGNASLNGLYFLSQGRGLIRNVYVVSCLSRQCSKVRDTARVSFSLSLCFRTLESQLMWFSLTACSLQRLPTVSHSSQRSCGHERKDVTGTSLHSLTLPANTTTATQTGIAYPLLAKQHHLIFSFLHDNSNGFVWY